jgi:hypothetical protein
MKLLSFRIKNLHFIKEILINMKKLRQKKLNKCQDKEKLSRQKSITFKSLLINLDITQKEHH